MLKGPVAGDSLAKVGDACRPVWLSCCPSTPCAPEVARDKAYTGMRWPGTKPTLARGGPGQSLHFPGPCAALLLGNRRRSMRRHVATSLQRQLAGAPSFCPFFLLPGWNADVVAELAQVLDRR